jgi:hypothetical protein
MNQRQNNTFQAMSSTRLVQSIWLWIYQWVEPLMKSQPSWSNQSPCEYSCIENHACNACSLQETFYIQTITSVDIQLEGSVKCFF